MPKSKLRKKDKKVIPEEILHPMTGPLESPGWLAPTMVGAFLIGLIWIVIFYVNELSNSRNWRLEYGRRFCLYRSRILSSHKMALITAV
jgi:hypothetical protein